MRWLCLSLLFLVLSCAPVEVVYDYDRKEDYTRFKTYRYFTPMNTGLGELDTRRMIRAVDTLLQAKGFVKLKDSTIPDFYVNIKSEMFQEMNSGGSIGVGVGGTGSNMGGGISVGVPINEPVMKAFIFFDMVDVAKDALFWQARCEVSYRDNLSPEQRQEYMMKIASKALKEFPPTD